MIIAAPPASLRDRRQIRKQRALFQLKEEEDVSEKTTSGKETLHQKAQRISNRMLTDLGKRPDERRDNVNKELETQKRSSQN